MTTTIALVGPSTSDSRTLFALCLASELCQSGRTLFVDVSASAKAQAAFADLGQRELEPGRDYEVAPALFYRRSLGEPSSFEAYDFVSIDISENEEALAPLLLSRDDAVSVLVLECGEEGVRQLPQVFSRWQTMRATQRPPVGLLLTKGRDDASLQNRFKALAAPHALGPPLAHVTADDADSLTADLSVCVQELRLRLPSGAERASSPPPGASLTSQTPKATPNLLALSSIVQSFRSAPGRPAATASPLLASEHSASQYTYVVNSKALSEALGTEPDPPATAGVPVAPLSQPVARTLDPASTSDEKSAPAARSPRLGSRSRSEAKMGLTLPFAAYVPIFFFAAVGLISSFQWMADKFGSRPTLSSTANVAHPRAESAALATGTP